MVTILAQELTMISWDYRPTSYFVDTHLVHINRIEQLFFIVETILNPFRPTTINVFDYLLCT